MERISSDSMLRLVWEHATDGLIMFEWMQDINDLRVIMINDVATTLTGLTEGALLCEVLPIHRDYNDELQGTLIDYYTEILRLGTPKTKVLHILGHSAVRGYWHNNSVPICQNDGCFLFMTFRNVTELEESKRKAQQQAATDELTGIQNRRAYNEMIERWCRQGAPFILASIDMNEFKQINDTYGHAAGDTVLESVARRIDAVCREGVDFAFRIGGDEFIALFAPGISKDEVGDILYDSIHWAIAIPQIPEGYNPSCAIGIVGYEPDVSPDDLKAAVDEQMYHSKSSRSPYSILRNWGDALYLIAKELKREFQQQEFLQLHYQKIVDLKTGETVSYEALIRWPREDGMIMPPTILAAVKRCGLAEEFCLWVIRQAQAQWVRWGCPESITIAVNLLPSDLKYSRVYKALERSQGLAIEITEHEILEDEIVLIRIAKLRTLGISCYMDDFGQKYSALARLHEMECDKVKIDQVLTNHPQLLKGASCLMNELGYPTVAEGIESEEVLEYLRKIGVPFGQGYLWGRPVPGDRVEIGESSN